MEIVLAFIGFFGLILMVVLLLLDKTSPQVTFILSSSIVGFLLIGLDSLSIFNINLEIGKILGTKSGVFGIKELAKFIESGVASVASTAALFIFSILFFTILAHAKVFDTIINALIKRSGNNIYGIMILSVAVAVIAHLDGSGASTFLIAIPALLPIYERFNIRKTTLMLVLTASMGVMNLLPWGGPTLRVATILQKDATELYFTLMPMQIVGLILAVSLALFMGYREQKLGNLRFDSVNNASIATQEHSVDTKFIINIIIGLVTLIVLFFSKLPTYFVFMLGSAVALIVNYPSLKEQNRIVKEASSSAMMMATMILCAGVLIGVFDKSGLMKLMAELLLHIMPQGFGHYLVLLVGISAVPMALIFCTDSYFYGLLPIAISVGAAFGVDAVALGIAMVVCRNCATFISPVVPATLLGCGLSGVSIRSHIKTSFFFVWGISIICLISGIILGIVHI